MGSHRFMFSLGKHSSRTGYRWVRRSGHRNSQYGKLEVACEDHSLKLPSEAPVYFVLVCALHTIYAYFIPLIRAYTNVKDTTYPSYPPSIPRPLPSSQPQFPLPESAFLYPSSSLYALRSLLF